MRETRRLLALAAVACMAMGAGIARAQTVVVKNAPRGSSVELYLNVDKIASAAVANTGEATLAANILAKGAENDVRVYLDVCDTVRRVMLVDRNLPPLSQGEGCARKEVPGFFAVRRVTTLMMDVGGPDPMVWLRQGPVPKSWFGEEQIPTAGGREAPLGFVLFGGAGAANVGDAVSIQCGNALQCSGQTYGFAGSGGAGYWITRYTAIEGGFIRPAVVDVTGSGDYYHFSTSLDTYAFVLIGKVGVPLRTVRPYGFVGANYQYSTSTTQQTINDLTIVVDGVSQTIPGGTQTFVIKTSGWGWLFGGGLEAWLTRYLAVYGEAGRMKLEGSSDESSARTDRWVTCVQGGIRIHLGR